MGILEARLERKGMRALLKKAGGVGEFTKMGQKTIIGLRTDWEEGRVKLVSIVPQEATGFIWQLWWCLWREMMQFGIDGVS